mgnify:FL=1
MKTELEDRDMERIAEKVVERLKPLFSNSRDSGDSKVMDVKRALATFCFNNY